MQALFWFYILSAINLIVLAHLANIMIKDRNGVLFRGTELEKRLKKREQFKAQKLKTT